MPLDERFDPLISTFGAGELNPLLLGRTDLNWYGAGCQLLRNFIAITEGAATRRPPTLFVAEVPDSSQLTILKRFEFSTTQAYQVEFGNSTARFYADKGIIVDGSGNPIQIVSPYLSTELRQLKTVQSADVLFLFHPNHAVQQLERLSNTDWQITPLPFVDGPYLDVNADDSQTLTPSATGGNITLTWNGPGGATPPFAATDVGRLVRVGYIAPDWQASTVYAVGQVVKNGANGVYRCVTAGTSAGAGGPTGTDIGIGDGSVGWNYLNAGGVEWGYAQIAGYVSPSQVNASVLTSFAASGATIYWRLGLYSETSGYPACGILHQQRMFMAGCANNPDRVDGSVTADFGNFTPGDTDSDPVADTIGLPGVDAIHWMASKRTLFLGTQGTVEKVYGSNGYDSAITQSSIEVIEQVSRGAYDLAPVRIINGLVYLHRLGRKILELYYDFTQDLDQATELTARARHLTVGGIVDMDYQQEPYSILWTARADGVLVGCTYYREQQFIAWHAHQLGGGGIVESVSVIPGAEADQLWMVVRRTINGVTKRYVEVMDDFNGVEDSVADENLFFGDCYFLYEGAPATVIPPIPQLAGMPVVVLADGNVIGGMTLDANGSLPALPVAASTVYVGLDYSGYPDSALLPMPIEAGATAGTPVGRKKKINELFVGLYRSGPFQTGGDNAHLRTQEMRTGADNMDQAVPLWTGIYHVDDFDDDFRRDAAPLIVPIGPLPLTVLWLGPRIKTETG